MTAIAADAPRSRLPHWFSAGHLCIDWPFGAIYVIAPAIAVEMDLNPVEVGLLLTVQSIGAAIAYLPAGLLADRVSDRGRLLTITFFWVVVGYTISSLAPSYWILAATMALACMGDAAWHPIATGVLTRAAPNQRARVLGIHAIGGTLSGVAAPLVAGWCLQQAALDWRETLQIALVPTVLAGFAFLFFVARRVPRVEARTSSALDIGGLLRVWTTKRGALLTAVMLLYNLSLLGAMAMTPLFLREKYGLDFLQMSMAFAGIILAGALVQPMVGRLSDGLGRLPVLVTGCLIAAAGALIVYQADELAVAIAGLVACIGALEAIRSAVLASAVDLSGRGEGTTLGAAFVVLDGVGAFGAVLAGWVATSGLENTYILTAGLALASAMVALVSHRIVHRRTC